MNIYRVQNEEQNIINFIMQNKTCYENIRDNFRGIHKQKYF